MVPSQVYALVGSKKKGQVLGGMVAAGAGTVLTILLLLSYCVFKSRERTVIFMNYLQFSYQPSPRVYMSPNAIFCFSLAWYV